MNERIEIQKMVDHDSLNILEVGCGHGALSQALKKTNERRIIIGIDPVAELKDYFFSVFMGKFEDYYTNGDERFKFDCILFPDVLEHMVDPWSALKKAHGMLADGGYIIVSVPNVSHWSVIVQLMYGNFHYQDSGILDRTHLRFFTPAGISDAIERAGFRIIADYEHISEVPLEIRPIFKQIGSIHNREVYQSVIKAIRK